MTVAGDWQPLDHARIAYSWTHTSADLKASLWLQSKFLCSLLKRVTLSPEYLIEPRPVAALALGIAEFGGRQESSLKLLFIRERQTSITNFLYEGGAWQELVGVEPGQTDHALRCALQTLKELYEAVPSLQQPPFLAPPAK
eukprot:1159714-Pelagomonas_calceolata.AAC.5